MELIASLSGYWKGFVEALKDIDYKGPFNYETRHQEGDYRRRIKTLEENFNFIKAQA
jgi:sugar phosphate isomerase/epimerase